MEHNPKPFRLDDDSIDWEAILITAIGLFWLWRLWDQLPEALLMYKTWPPILLVMSGAAAGMTLRHTSLFRALGQGTMAVMVIVGSYRQLTLGFDGKLGSWARFLIGVIGLCFLVYYAVAHFRAWLSRDEGDDEDTDDDGSDRPMLSLVLLCRQGRFMEASVLAKIIEEAWGGDYSSESETGKTGFVVGDKPIFMVKTPLGMFISHFMDSQYWDDTEGLAEKLEDLRLRQAILDHQAWISVDLVDPADEAITHEVAYAAISRLVYELADEDVVAILKPATGQVNIWTDDVAEMLLRPDGPERFNQRTVDPVLRVDSNDPRMDAAVAEARDRWPEFVSAFQSRSNDDVFLVKAPITVDDRTEFIWTKVHGLEPTFIHGKLANQPVRLGNLREGSTVEIATSDLSDWGYFKGEEAGGFFTDKVIAEQRRERQLEDGIGDTE